MSSILDEEAIREAIRAMYLDGERPAPSITAHELRMKESRTRLRVGFKLPAAVAAALILVVVLFMATPLHHPGRLGPSGSTNPAPAGWVTYSAYGIQLSVPKSWAVSFFPGCPVSATEPGLLTIARYLQRHGGRCSARAPYSQRGPSHCRCAWRSHLDPMVHSLSPRIDHRYRSRSKERAEHSDPSY